MNLLERGRESYKEWAGKLFSEESKFVLNYRAQETKHADSQLLRISELEGMSKMSVPKVLIIGDDTIKEAMPHVSI